MGYRGMGLVIHPEENEYWNSVIRQDDLAKNIFMDN
jgi:hypothetical protein